MNDLIFSKYKCFEDLTKLEDLKQINIIIGKNNIGKSSLIDVVEYACGTYDSGLYKCDVYRSETINEDNVNKTFENDNSIIRSGSFYGKCIDIAKKNINKKILAKVKCRRENGTTHVDYSHTKDIQEFNDDLSSNAGQWKDKYIRYNFNKSFKRIYAERDIGQEETKGDRKVSGKGEGVTNIINKFINDSNLEESVIENDLLSALNQIMKNDAVFERITVQREADNKWEIFLKEKDKNRVALSESGSGLKTILMILVFTILIPKSEGRELNNYVFAFEEIENNLHPSLLRRTLQYIEEVANKGAQFFLTTHSNVMLDAFQNKDGVSAYNVIREGNKSIVKCINDVYGQKQCLDELGFKASDLLQSNGIIWVEGPSDRVYINKWIELWSDGKYREGMDYQCVFYGGRLLSHLSIDDTEKTDKFVNILNVNKNAVIVIDSDKKSANSSINNTKKRIKEECGNSIEVWITKGREIENYVPKEIIDKCFDINSIRQFEKYDDIKEYLSQSGQDNLGTKFERDKVGYAYRFIEKMTRENMIDSLDLNERMLSIISRIEEWNK